MDYDRSLVNWGEFVRFKISSNEIYAETGPRFSTTSKDECPVPAEVVVQTYNSAVFGRLDFVSSSSHRRGWWKGL